MPFCFKWFRICAKGLPLRSRTKMRSLSATWETIPCQSSTSESTTIRGLSFACTPNETSTGIQTNMCFSTLINTLDFITTSYSIIPKNANALTFCNRSINSISKVYHPILAYGRGRMKIKANRAPAHPFGSLLQA